MNVKPSREMSTVRDTTRASSAVDIHSQAIVAGRSQPGLATPKQRQTVASCPGKVGKSRNALQELTSSQDPPVPEPAMPCHAMPCHHRSGCNLIKRTAPPQSLSPATTHYQESWREIRHTSPPRPRPSCASWSSRPTCHTQTHTPSAAPSARSCTTTSRSPGALTTHR